MTTKDYNALAAEMMGYGWEAGLVIFPDGDNMEQFFWNPLENRNQAHQLLKRAEELGLADEVEASIYLKLKYLKGFGWPKLNVGEINWLILTCPTDTITMACVDAWEARREPVPEPASLSEDAKEKFYQHLDSYHLQEEKQQ